MMKMAKQPIKKGKAGGVHIVPVIRCKYCRGNLYSHKSFKRHIRNHEKKYRKHWNKKKVIKQRVLSETSSYTINTRGKEREIANEEKRRTKAKFFVYIVYASKPACSCDKENQVKNMPCNCSFTYKQVIYSSIAQLHRNIQNDVVSYECQGCKSTVQNVTALETGQEFQCNRCNGGFLTENNLKVHQQVCLKFIKLGQVYKCLQCKTQHKSHEEMVQHTSNVHTLNDSTPLNVSVNICPVCGNNYATTKLLKAHLQTHPSYMKTGLVCCVCGLKEKDAFKLAQHAGLHANGNNNKIVKLMTKKEQRIINPLQSGSGSKSRSGARTRSKSIQSACKSHSVSEMRCESVSRRWSGYDKRTDEPMLDCGREIRFESGITSGMGTSCVTRYGSGSQTRPESVLKIKQSTSMKPTKTDGLVEHGELVQPSKKVREIKVVEKANCALSNSGMRLRPRKQDKPTMYVDDIQHEQELETTSLFPDLPHACGYCERAFTSIGYLNTHKRTVHFGRNPYLCLICKRRFSDEILFNLHQEMHKESFKCSFCQETFDRLELLHNHDQIHNKSQFSTFKCPDCTEAFHDAKNLYEHMQSHRKEVPKIPITKSKTNIDESKSVRYPCTSCERTFPSQFALRIHQKSVHKSDKVFECKYCKKQFKFESDHKIHESLHKEHSGVSTEAHKFKCKYCGKGLKRKSDLKLHEALHEANGKEFPCDQCDKVFKHKQEMKHHRRSHFRDKLSKPTKCPECNETFVWGTQLRDHKKTHWAEKPFLCVYCRKRFKTQEELTEHEPQHTKDKRHECHICNRRFKDKAHIRDHMLIHTGEKPFSCNYCGKQFRQKGQLRTHERVHTRETPFVCDICSRAFLYWSSLNVHKKSHYKGKPPEEVEKILKKSRKLAKKKEADIVSKEKVKKKKQEINSSVQTSVEVQQQQSSAGQQLQQQESQQVSAIVSTQSVQQQQSQEPGTPQQHELPSETLQLSQQDIQHQPVPNIRQNMSLPIHLTIPSNTEQMQVEHIASQLQRQPEELHQQQQQPHPSVATDTPWETLHARYLNNPPHHHQTWQQAPPSWQSLSTTQPMQNPGTSWEMAPAGNWTASGATGPPAAHQSHTSSILTSALYGIMQRDNDGRGFQQ